MSRVKVALLGLLVALTVSAIMSASAAEASTHNYKVEGKTIGKGEKEEAKVLGSNIKFWSTIGGLKVIVECHEFLGPGNTNTLEESGKSKFEFKFKSGCLLLEVKEEKTLDISSCKVVEPLTLKGEGELTGPVSFPGIEYKEKAKESLGTLELEGGTCAIAKKSEIKGVFLADEFEIAIRTIRLAQYVAQQNTKATLGAEPIYIFANMETSLNSNKLLAVE